MRLDDKYIDKPDDFSRKVGEKLRDHPIAVDPDVWDSLAKRLPPRKRGVASQWLWAAAAVAAIVSLVLFLTHPFSDEPLLTKHLPSTGQLEQEADVPLVIPEKTADMTVEEPAISPFSEEYLAESQQVSKQVGSDVSVSRAKKKSGVDNDTKKENGIENGAKKGSGVEKDTKKENEIRKDSKEWTGIRNDIKKESIEGEEKRKIVEGKVEFVSTIAEEGITESKEVSKSGEIAVLAEEVEMGVVSGPQSLIAALGSGDGLDLSWEDFMDAADDPLNSDSSPGDGGYGSSIIGSGDDSHSLSPADYADVEHRLPVTFSLTVDFPIGKDVTLETGLSYTYLLSRLSNDGYYNYRGSLQQHYIGIPVNLRYTVWHNDAWNIYLLGGGSIEKGIRSVFKQKVVHNDVVVNQSKDYDRIDGFQLSAQGGAGFSYRLHGNLHLFGEPRIIYYFRNNQPMSARTENPLIFGLNMGIRIQFK